jgi:hypothetical protein
LLAVILSHSPLPQGRETQWLASLDSRLPSAIGQISNGRLVPPRRSTPALNQQLRNLFVVGRLEYDLHTHNTSADKDEKYAGAPPRPNISTEFKSEKR